MLSCCESYSVDEKGGGGEDPGRGFPEARNETATLGAAYNPFGDYDRQRPEAGLRDQQQSRLTCWARTARSWKEAEARANSGGANFPQFG